MTIEDLCGAGNSPLGETAAGLTGEIRHVDVDCHVIGMNAEAAPDMTVD